jgi:hypothetical protein
MLTVSARGGGFWPWQECDQDAQPVDLVDDHDVHEAVLDVLDELRQGRTVEGASGIAAVVIALAETFSPASRCRVSPALTDQAPAQGVDTARVKLAPNANADRSGNPKSGLWFAQARHKTSHVCLESVLANKRNPAVAMLGRARYTRNQCFVA